MRRNEQEAMEMYRQICGLRKEGIRRKDICELFGCSVSTVDRAIRLCGEKEIRRDSFEEHREQVLTMYADGATLKEIADAAGMSVSAINRRLRKMELRRGKGWHPEGTQEPKRAYRASRAEGAGGASGSETVCGAHPSGKEDPGQGWETVENHAGRERLVDVRKEDMMFERFGEFDSYVEINKKAAELLAAADTDAVRKLAEENGLDPEDAEGYITGDEKEFCSQLMAAFGKLDIEVKYLEIGGLLNIWADYIRDMCTEVPGMAEAVRKKGKSLGKCMSRLIRFSYENKVRVSDKIVDITKVTHNGREEKMQKPLFIGFPDMATAKRIIREYYLGRG